MADSEDSPLTAESLVEIRSPDSLTLSPNGTQVLYVPQDTIWLADVGKEYSARQITSGEKNDVLLRWSPSTEGLIAFVSDRLPNYSAVHCLRLTGGEAYAIESTKRCAQLSDFEVIEWSPDGQFIAFVCRPYKQPDTSTQNGQKTREPRVCRERWSSNQLRCVEVSTQESFTLFEGDGEPTRQIAWSADGKDIVFTTSKPKDANSQLHGTIVRGMSVATKECKSICQFPGAIFEIVSIDSEIYFTAFYDPRGYVTSIAVYRILPNSQSIDVGDNWEHRAFGVTDADGSIKAIGDSYVAVLVEDGLKSRIHLHSDKIALQSAGPKIIYDGMHEIPCWDVAEKGAALVLTKSDASNPLEVFSVKNGECCQLSQHCKSIAKHKIGEAKAIYCKADDGTEFDGVFFKPNKGFAWYAGLQ